MNVTKRLLDGLLVAAKATGKVLDPTAVFVGLYISGPSVTPPATAAHFTLPDATDCPAVALGTLSAPHYLSNGCSVMDAPAKIFALPDDTNAFTATGYYLADAATGGNILAYEALPSPMGLLDEHYAVTVVVRITVDPSGQWSATAVIEG